MGLTQSGDVRSCPASPGPRTSAVACLACDAGFPIEVESEYLPIRLLDRSWLGEFDT